MPVSLFFWFPATSWLGETRRWQWFGRGKPLLVTHVDRDRAASYKWCQTIEAFGFGGSNPPHLRYPSTPTHNTHDMQHFCSAACELFLQRSLGQGGKGVALDVHVQITIAHPTAIHQSRSFCVATCGIHMLFMPLHDAWAEQRGLPPHCTILSCWLGYPYPPHQHKNCTFVWG